MTRWIGPVSLVVIAIAVFLANPTSCRAQSYVYEYGSYPWTTPMPVPGGYVDAGNGNLHIEIPIASIAERGHVPFVAKLVYDSHIWQQVSSVWQPKNVINSWSGWRLVTSAAAGTNFNDTVKEGTCTVVVDKIEIHPPYYTYENFTWTAPDGHIIPFGNISTYYSEDNYCGASVPTANGLATDASGYHLYVTNFTSATIYAPDGTQVFPNVKDTNGNYYSAPNGNGDVTDTLGRTPISTTVNGSAITYNVLNSQGGTSHFVVTTETIPVSTAFGQSGVTEYASTAPSTDYLTVIESIALPDGTSYQFSYDEGLTSGHYGVLTGMTLPTTGTVTFTHSNFKDAYGNQNLWAESSSWGGPTGGTWSFTPLVLQSCPTGCTQQMTEVGPSGEKTVYGFTLNDGAWDTSAASYDTTANGGGLLQTVTTAYDFATPPYIIPTVVKTTLPVPGGSINQERSYTYDSSNFGNITLLTESNFYSSSYAAYRTTTYAYLTNSDNNMVNKKQTISVCAGSAQCTSSNYVSSTQIAYDGATTSSMTGVIGHDDTNFGTSYTARGNPTTIQLMAYTTVVSATTTLAYDMTGQVTSSTDNNGNKTTFSYSDSYFNDTSSGPSSASPAGKTNAFVTQMTLPSPFNWTNSFGYYLSTSQLATKTDQNALVTTNSYLDSLSRPTMSKVKINTTNYSWKMKSYTNSNETVADSYTGVSDATPVLPCSSCRHDQTNLDSFGRPLTQLLVNDPDGQDTVTAAYTNGRLSSLTDPKRSTSSPTDNTDSYVYDGLGRVTKVTHSDGSSFFTYYGASVSAAGGISTQLCSSSTYGLGYPVLYIDEAAKKRQIWTDGLGRKIEVDEQDNSGNLTQNTCYTYSILNNLTGVTQGTQSRTFQYDSLSRMTSATTPETGTVTYSYVTTTLALCSGNPYAACYRHDGRAFTNYAYDSLNRLTGITYSTLSSAVIYTYDAGTNQKGFLTGMSDSSGSTTWGYNNVGWVTSEQRTIAGKTNSMSYTYNGDGTIGSVTYPSSRTITYTVSNAERATSAKDLTNNIQYGVTASYAPVGSLNSVLYGPATGFNGVTTTAAYNSRLEPTGASASSTAGTAQNLSFNYPSTGNDGMVTGIQNNVISGLSESFTYDSLNRILSAATTATSGPGCWGQTFGPTGAPPPGPPDDRWSNLSQINVTNCSAGALGIAVSSTTNQVTTTGYSYDASGNMTSEPTPIGYTYSYDAENHLTQAAGTSSGTWNYVYDGHGLRVEKSNSSGGTLYWRSIPGATIAETDLTGSTTNTAYREYIFFAGQRIASRDASGNVYYYYRDQIGSTTAITTASGTPCYQAAFTPYGQEMTTQTTCESNYKFSGYERDAETGLDYAFARYYNSRLARFMSADPLGGGTSDPQSLNRYAYVENAPMNSIDPSGMYHYCPAPGGCDWGEDDSPFMAWIPWLTSYPTWLAGGYIYGENGDWSMAGYSWQYGLMPIIWGGSGPYGNVKDLIRQIFKNNQDCADLFGGEDKANSTLDTMTVIQVPMTPAVLTAPNDAEAWNAIAQSNAGQNNYAAYTSWTTSAGTTAWNQESYSTFVGTVFSNLALGQQAAVFMHEMAHPTTGYSSTYANGAMEQPDSPYSPQNLFVNCVPPQE
ncbi:MAG TPA: RHS repeat-associated core domain-containing protein [Candidatus Acidoferrales bacterium]|nr:RHS repeat-associated core domain-containing protein [Candidatus Acidoferrales bacterium]